MDEIAEEFDNAIEQLQAMHQGINEILDKVDFYRSACTAHGYGEESVETMTLEFHRLLLEQIFGAMELVYHDQD